MVNDQTSATVHVTVRGNVYLGKMSEFVSYLTTNYSTQQQISCPTGSDTTNTAAISMIQSQLVASGLLTVANGLYSVVGG